MRALAIALLVAARAIAAPLPDALQKFEAGEYEAVVTTLRASIDANAIGDPVDRAQALRLYGIACVLTGRSLAAEAAFLHWLSLDARARLDPGLVRPDVVAFFEQVRARHRDALLREVEKRRPRTAALNLLPPAGQFQNGQRTKFALLLTAEVALLATNIATGAALYGTQGDDLTFPDPGRAEVLRGINWVSFAALLGVVLYGVVDGFVVFSRLRQQAAEDADSLRADRGLVIHF